MWDYRAKLKRIVDGDTLEVIIDVGFHGTQTEQLRLLGVNTPEMKGASREAGLKAKQFTHEWLIQAGQSPSEWPLIVNTEKDDVFGRYLATVYRTADFVSLNQALLNSGNAVKDIR